MKKNRIILIILLISVLCGCGSSKQKNGLTLQGNCYDNRDDFLNYSETVNFSELSRAYLENVSYEITELDEDEMIATIDVEVPNITDILSEIIHSAVKSDESEVSYSDLRIKVEKEFTEKLINGEFDIESSTIQVPVEEVDGIFKIVSTDELVELIYRDIMKAYVEAIPDIGGEVQ